MTGRIRRFYFTVGLIAFLLVTLALLAASFRATPQGGLRNEPDRLAPEHMTLERAIAGGGGNVQTFKRSSVQALERWNAGTLERWNAVTLERLYALQSGTTQL